jgi:hypothetical protein
MSQPNLISDRIMLLNRIKPSLKIILLFGINPKMSITGIGQPTITPGH